MFCVSAAYPQKHGGAFDCDYLIKTHVPLVSRLAKLVKGEVRRGVASPDGSAPSFVCLANFWIKSAQDFHATLATHGGEIMADMPNLTNIQPILRLYEVLK